MKVDEVEALSAINLEQTGLIDLSIHTETASSSLNVRISSFSLSFISFENNIFVSW